MAFSKHFWWSIIYITINVVQKQQSRKRQRSSEKLWIHPQNRGNDKSNNKTMSEIPWFRPMVSRWIQDRVPPSQIICTTSPPQIFSPLQPSFLRQTSYFFVNLAQHLLFYEMCERGEWPNDFPTPNFLQGKRIKFQENQQKKQN